MAKTAYGKKINIQSAIDDNKIPVDTLIVTKDDTDPEILFYDPMGNLLPIVRRVRFRTLADAELWVATSPCEGNILSVLKESTWTPYIVQSDNTLVPLEKGDECILEMRCVGRTISWKYTHEDETSWRELLTVVDGKGGEDGKDGANGKSAYELACDNGFDGTLSEWLDSLIGESGKDGVNGTDGEPGYTPVKGVDYYTEADKAEMVTAVLAALPNGDEVYY